MSSIFTKIINREIPAYIVWENENFIAFLDINPNNPGHTLLVPKQETPYIFEMTDDTYIELFKNAKLLAGILKKATNAQRIGVVVEGLGVPDHAHLHLIPINNVGELDSLHKASMSPEELELMAQKIREAITA